MLHIALQTILLVLCCLSGTQSLSLARVRKVGLEGQIEYSVTTTPGTFFHDDLKLYISLIGHNGQSKKLYLDGEYNEYVGPSQDFTIFTDELYSPLIAIEISKDNISSPWFLHEIEVSVRVPDTEKYIEQVFLFFDRLDNGAQQNVRIEFDQKRYKYRVTTKTGTIQGADTDSKVYISLIGHNGQSKKILLDHQSGDNIYHKSDNKFTLGAYEVFHTATEELYSPLVAIEISKDDGDSWFLEEVEVYISIRDDTSKLFPSYVPYTEISQEFPFHGWLENGAPLNVRIEIKPIYSDVYNNSVKYSLSQQAAAESVDSDEEAQRKCEELGGYLAEIDNQAEQDFVAAFLDDQREHLDALGTLGRGFPIVYISGSDETREGTWVHQRSGEELAFENWVSDSYHDVKKNCVRMRGSKSWKWSDTRCTKWSRPTGYRVWGRFLCELPV